VRAVNLLPSDERGKGLDASARKPLLGAAFGIALVTVFAALFASLAALDAGDKRSQLEAVEDAIAALPKPEQPAVDVNALVQERTDRESALATALTGRVSFDSLMRQVALVLPADAWLTQLDATAPIAPADEAAAAAPLASSGVTIQGATWTHDGVAVVLARLSAIPTLTDVRLTSASRVEPQAAGDGEGGSDSGKKQRVKPYVTFVVSANMRTGDVS
jgi:Tfp pilus assembly protein PilN